MRTPETNMLCVNYILIKIYNFIVWLISAFIRLIGKNHGDFQPWKNTSVYDIVRSYIPQ